MTLGNEIQPEKDKDLEVGMLQNIVFFEPLITSKGNVYCLNIYARKCFDIIFKMMNSGLFFINFYLPGQCLNLYVRSTFPSPIT